MDESSFCSMEEVFKEMIGSGSEEVLEDLSGTYPPMYVLTNKRRLNGAVEILDAKVLRRCADVFEKYLSSVISNGVTDKILFL